MSNTINAKFRNIYKPVDIIIPFHGQYHLLGECIESLVTKTLGIMYTLTLVDDCSPNKEFMSDLQEKKLKKYPLQYIRHAEQKGFGAALKTGFDNTQNDWVLFLHADCRIEQTDWLVNMQESMAKHKDKGVKLISAKVNDGGTGGFDPNVIGDIQKKNMDIVAIHPLPLICCLMHRELFNHIDGFVKSYPYGWYEDEELFWRMKLRNFKQMICATSYVYHHGGTTMKELIKDYKIKPIIEDNKETYISDVQAFAKRR